MSWLRQAIAADGPDQEGRINRGATASGVSGGGRQVELSRAVARSASKRHTSRLWSCGLSRACAAVSPAGPGHTGSCQSARACAAPRRGTRSERERGLSPACGLPRRGRLRRRLPLPLPLRGCNISRGRNQGRLGRWAAARLFMLLQLLLLLLACLRLIRSHQLMKPGFRPQIPSVPGARRRG